MKNFVPHFIQERFRRNETHGHFTAYAMFVDLSGFTHLTQTLMKRGNVGAEQLSSILNDIFGPMVELVYRRGGFIPYYAGDAFTAVFTSDSISTEEFLDTAERLHGLTDGPETEFHGFKIRTKIGLSYGDIEWGIVGGENKSFYFRGAAINGSADAQMQAAQQEIYLDAAVADLAKKHIALQADQANEFFLWQNPKDFKSLELPPQRKVQVSDAEILPAFFPQSVLKYDGRGEFRNVISVFISFKGIDNHELLNRFTSIVLDEISSFSGYFKEVDFGDKGGLMVGFFGAPVTFENNTERALEFVTALQENTADLIEETSLRFRVGITSGIAYTGIIGSAERCQYAAVGSNVNLAARLMSYADWNEVATDEEVHRNRLFRFRHKGAINYKGFEKPISTYRLDGRNTTARPDYSGEMIGRDKELTDLVQEAEKTFATKKAGLIYLYGEAGIGKSRLTHELRKKLTSQRPVYWMTCPADQILRKPFNPFITFFKNYFSQSTENSKSQNAVLFSRGFDRFAKDAQKIEQEDNERLSRDLRKTKSVLESLIGLPPTDDFWEKLDAQGRFRNTLQAISDFFTAEANTQNLVLELEDGHWYDDYSKSFLQDFIRQIKDLPVFLLITSRYADDGTKPRLIEEEILKTHGIIPLEFDLNILQPKAIRDFAEKRLSGSISADFFELLQRTTNGNPFYLEQILEYFSESNLLLKEKDAWTIKDKNIKLSGSINAVLTARIDRLSGLVKETVKAAAVIGREFEIPVLQEVLLQNDAYIERNGDSSKVLREQIASAEKGQIWLAMNELRYIFKHSLLREAVYDMQLRAQLRELHAHIATAIERLYQDNPENHYDDLAFHFEQAAIKDKARIYFEKAARHARRNFQNQQALVYYDKLINVLSKNEPKERIKALLSKATILELIGQWESCEETCQQALQLTEETDNPLLSGRAHDSLGHLLMLKGDYDAAGGYLHKAAEILELLKDSRALSKVYGNLGNLNFRQGEYEKAKSYFTRSIELSRLDKHTVVHAQIVANLGLTFMNQGQYDEGIRWQEDQLEICAQNGDKQGMATLYTNMGIVLLEKGDYDEALTCFENGLELCEELGNKQLTSIAIGCMGSVYERKGDYDRAMELFRKDLKITEELGDKQGISIALGLIGDLLNIRGEFAEAKDFMEKNLALTTELGYQKGIAKAVNTLGDIYFNRNEYEESIRCYNQAIEISSGINNLLILSESLLEKSEALLALNKIEEGEKCIEEAEKLAEEIGNQDLLFSAKILRAQVHIMRNEQEDAGNILENLLSDELERYEKAAVHYELHKISASDIHRDRALSLYKSLYSETPQYLYQERLRELEIKT